MEMLVHGVSKSPGPPRDLCSLSIVPWSQLEPSFPEDPFQSGTEPLRDYKAELRGGLYLSHLPS